MKPWQKDSWFVFSCYCDVYCYCSELRYHVNLIRLYIHHIHAQSKIDRCFAFCEPKHMPLIEAIQRERDILGGSLPFSYGYLMSILNWLINRCWKDITFYHCKNKQTILPGICTIYYVFKETCFAGCVCFFLCVHGKNKQPTKNLTNNCR